MTYTIQKHTHHTLFTDIKVVQTRYYGHATVLAVAVRGGDMLVVFILTCNISIYAYVNRKHIEKHEPKPDEPQKTQTRFINSVSSGDSNTKIQNMKIIDGKPEYKGALIPLDVHTAESFYSLDLAVTLSKIQIGSAVNSSNRIQYCTQDVLVKVTSKEAVFSLWKGFTQYFARLGPHTALTFIFLEQMNKFYKKIV